MVNTGHIIPFWDMSYIKNLNLQSRPFNDSEQYNTWVSHGYNSKIVGSFIDLTDEHFPKEITNYFSNWEGLKNIGLTIYKMTTSEILPVHYDTYSYYKDIFSLDSTKVDIYRTVVMLENWSSGHYIEINNFPIVNWKAGDWVSWKNDTPHMAANIGLNPRYTLQITGWRERGVLLKDYA